MTQPPPTDAERRLAAHLGTGFAILLVSIVALMTLGALVRAHEAGLACPDWPLCFGQVVPEMNLKVAFEWSHRALAGGISLGFLGLAIAVLRKPGLAPRLRPHLLATAAILAVQILLGALTVWHLLATWTVTSHLLTGNAFAVATLLTGLRLREIAHPGRCTAIQPSPQLRGVLAATAAVLVLQVALGGLVSSSFAGLACPEWPRCNGGRWFPSLAGPVGLHLAHRTNAYLVFALLVVGAIVARHTPGVRGLASCAALLGLVQLLVGIANVLLGVPVEVTGLHSLLAALLVLTTATAVRAAWWPHEAPIPLRV